MNTGSSQILARLKDVPSLPVASLKVLQLMHDPEVDLQELVRLIGYDVALTANILKLANSAFFGCSRTIGSVREAVVRLGTHKLSELIVSSAVTPLIQKPLKGYDLPAGELWLHSAAVAIAARELQAVLGVNAPDTLFTAALLHDIGKIVLGHFVETNADSIKAIVAAEKVSFLEAEQRVLGIDHAEVGAALLETWNLPPEIVAIVRCHHQPDGYPGDPRGVDIVHIADALCINCGIGNGIDGLCYRPSEASVARLGVTVHTSEAVAAKLLGGIDELKNLFAPGTGR